MGLVLGGGGARGAYQVGAVRALSDILGQQESPFQILTGLSAGAINSVALGIDADDFPGATQRLTETWMSLEPKNVYRTDMPKLATVGMRWLKDLTTGGVLGRSRANYLLDTAPLRELLTRVLDTDRLASHLRSGLLRGAAVSATNYLTGTTVSFFDGDPTIKPWVRHGRIAQREQLRVDHVLASAAIPIFFPPVEIDGKFFGDGGIRMTAPISPAIHLGAEKIVAIGIRYFRTSEQTVAINRETMAPSVSLAKMAGVLLNSVFLDSLDNDMERLERINRTLGFVPEATRRNTPDFLRPIPALSLRPSQDLGRMASDQYDKFPTTLRHLLGGIGATGESGWDLLSYVAFQPEYVGKLIELGYADTLARRAEIETFFGAN
ncbi:MAG: patatin-like phospholipase family protein [Polyangiales bacterium]